MLSSVQCVHGIIHGFKLGLKVPKFEKMCQNWN